MVEGEVKPQQVERPHSLLTIEFLGDSEILQVLMVSPDLDRVLRTFKVVSPLFQTSDNGQHLHIMNLIVVHDQIQHLGQEHNWVPSTGAERGGGRGVD
jgi:hypothetical protein